MVTFDRSTLPERLKSLFCIYVYVFTKRVHVFLSLLTGANVATNCHQMINFLQRNVATLALEIQIRIVEQVGQDHFIPCNTGIKKDCMIIMVQNFYLPMGTHT